MRGMASKLSADLGESLRRQGRVADALRRPTLKDVPQAMVVTTGSNGPMVFLSRDFCSTVPIALAGSALVRDRPAGGGGCLRNTIPQVKSARAGSPQRNVR